VILAAEKMGLHFSVGGLKPLPSNANHRTTKELIMPCNCLKISKYISGNGHVTMSLFHIFIQVIDLRLNEGAMARYFLMRR